MRNFIVNSDENLKIDKFKNLAWQKKVDFSPNSLLQSKLFKLGTVISNVKDNGCYYVTHTEGISILGFLGNMGEVEHPLIEFSYAASWYNSNIGGIYLIGLDEKNGTFFAPVA